MFSLLRNVLIIAAIFYYSPVRQSGEGVLPSDNLFGFAEAPQTAPAAAAEPPARLETVWQALPDSAKAAIIDRILSTSGLGASSVPASDTLTAGDRRPPWRGDAKQAER